MLFDEVSYLKPYWLASVGIDADKEDCTYSVGGVDSQEVFYHPYNFRGFLFSEDGVSESEYKSVRPVVVLKSNITVDDIHKIEEQKEQEWLAIPDL